MFNLFFNLGMIGNIVAAFLTAFIVGFVYMPFFIRWMRDVQKKGQPIRTDGPQTHLAKKGTPTMGGVVILSTITLSTLFWMPLTNGFVWILLFVMLSMGALGFADDYLKLKSQSSMGITGPKRLFVEFVIGTIATLWAMSLLPPEMATVVRIPYLAHTFIPLGLAYIAFAAIVFAGTTNAVNLTDGLDGLVSVPLMIAFFCFGVFGFIAGMHTDSIRFGLDYLPHVGAVTIFASAAIGALAAFLCYNKKPAKIFMGDVGALGLGAALGMIAIITKQEILLAIIGALFVIEALSDIIQVGSYKYRHKRVFLMAPIHHHFEKMGWSEVKVVRSFWLFSAVMGVIGLLSLL